MANAFAVAAEKARKANEKRYTQGMSLWDEIIQRYQPGGAFGAGAMASYERGKTKAVGAGMQQLVSAGLANTTVAATIGKKYEEEVGTPFRTQLEDMRMGRLSQAQEGKAGFIERREDVAPSGQLAMQSGYLAGFGQAGAGGSVRNQGFGSSDPGAGARARRESAKDRASAERIAGMQYGGGGTGGRAGAGGGFTSSYNPAGLNMEQLYGPATYGEPGGPAGPPAPKGYGGGLPPTYGEPGGPAGPPAPEGYSPGAQQGVAQQGGATAPPGVKTMMQGGKQMMQVKLKGYSSATWVEVGKYEMGPGGYRKKAATSKPTTSYASKGGGFGGRGF